MVSTIVNPSVASAHALVLYPRRNIFRYTYIHTYILNTRNKYDIRVLKVDNYNKLYQKNILGRPGPTSRSVGGDTRFTARVQYFLFYILKIARGIEFTQEHKFDKSNFLRVLWSK